MKARKRMTLRKYIELLSKMTEIAVEREDAEISIQENATTVTITILPSYYEPGKQLVYGYEKADNIEI